MNLAEFLLARIAEDEWAALPFRDPLGVDDVWRCDEIGGKVRSVMPQHFGNSDVMSESDTHLTAAHIARHDPARVLAECEAKRRIVEVHRTLPDDPEPFCWNCDEEAWPCKTMAYLAMPYADHPDYDEAWHG